MNSLHKTGIALSVGLAAVLSSGSASHALIFNVSIMGTFNDGGTFNGTFQYDNNNGTPPMSVVPGSVVINTMGGSPLFSNIYTQISSSDSMSLAVLDEVLPIFFTLTFNSSLDTPLGSITGIELQRTFANGGSAGNIISGTFTSTPVGVPYEFESATGLAILGLGYGLNKLRKRKSNPSKPETDTPITEEKTEKELTHV